MHWSWAPGAGLVRRLCARWQPRGARVTLVARTASDVQAVAAMIGRAGGNAVAIAADLNDVSALGPLIGDAVARGGGLDFLVHTAGEAAPAPFESTTAEALNAAFHFNIAAPFELTKAAVGHLRERPGAAIVTITSMMGHIAVRGLITYGTVKAAAYHMMRKLAVELASRIRVNAVAPGIIATEGLTAAVAANGRDQIAAANPAAAPRQRTGRRRGRPVAAVTGCRFHHRQGHRGRRRADQPLVPL
jgi:7-alpha-hydroxysteroid dehydrogenase